MTVGGSQERVSPLPQHLWSLEVPQYLAAHVCCHLYWTAPINIVRHGCILQVCRHASSRPFS